MCGRRSVNSVMYPSAVKNVELKLAALPTLPPGSIAVMRNLNTKDWRCARVQKNGHLRLAVPSDEGDRLHFAEMAVQVARLMRLAAG